MYRKETEGDSNTEKKRERERGMAVRRRKGERSLSRKNALHERTTDNEASAGTGLAKTTLH